MESGRFRMASAAVVLGMGAAASQGALLVDYAPDQAYGDNMSYALVADNFTLAGSGTYAISNIRFWSLQSKAADALPTIHWAIYSDAGGVPDAVVIDGTPSVSGAATGNSTGFGYTEFVFDIAVSFQLAAGNYWLALQNGALGDTGFNEMVWSTTSAGTGPLGRYIDFSANSSSWEETGNEHAFAITGTLVTQQVPLPPTLPLALAGLMAAATFTRRGRTTPAEIDR